ncbi:MAG TPA: hypothetical protein PKC44_14855 [Agitococcus sp.]|nr:hypothetical protein [Agitococcus sp.]
MSQIYPSLEKRQLMANVALCVAGVGAVLADIIFRVNSLNG